MQTPIDPATLLPCPFCGGEAEAITGPVPCWWGVICRNCDVWRDDRAATKAEAIAAWNRRASTHPAGTLLLIREDGCAEVVEADVVGLLRGAQDAVNAAYSEAHAEWQGNDSRMAKHSARVDAWREKARAALSALQSAQQS